MPQVRLAQRTPEVLELSEWQLRVELRVRRADGQSVRLRLRFAARSRRESQPFQGTRSGRDLDGNGHEHGAQGGHHSVGSERARELAGSSAALEESSYRPPQALLERAVVLV